MLHRELVDPVTYTLCSLLEKPSTRKYLRPEYEMSTLLRDFFEPNLLGGTVNELPSFDFSRRYVYVHYYYMLLHLFRCTTISGS